MATSSLTIGRLPSRAENGCHRHRFWERAGDGHGRPQRANRYAAGDALTAAGSVVSTGRRGMSTPRTRPIRVNTSIIVRATAKGLPAGSLTATMTEPTRAVPNEDPRLETLRDSPEMSPWSRSGQLDWTTLTDEVSMTPIPAPNRNSPGTQVQTPECALTRASSRIMPTAVIRKPAMISHRCG